MTEHESLWFMVPTSTEWLVQVVVEPIQDCFELDKVVETYSQRHSEDFGWIQSGSKISLPPLNHASRENFRTLLRGIKRHFTSRYGCRFPEIAYMLATARVESYDFRRAVFFSPIAEIISKEAAEASYGTGPTARRPEVAKNMGNDMPGDGYRYRGRGLVQITWKRNYRVFGELLGLDLVAAPELALDWDVAIQILVEGMVRGLFTGKKLSDFITDDQVDFIGARRIINGTDRAAIISDYAERFLLLLEDASCADC